MVKEYFPHAVKGLRLASHQGRSQVATGTEYPIGLIKLSNVNYLLAYKGTELIGINNEIKNEANTMDNLTTNNHKLENERKHLD